MNVPEAELACYRFEDPGVTLWEHAAYAFGAAALVGLIGMGLAIQERERQRYFQNVRELRELQALCGKR